MKMVKRVVAALLLLCVLLGLAGCGSENLKDNIVSPQYLTTAFPKLLERNGLQHIRYHDAPVIMGVNQKPE